MKFNMQQTVTRLVVAVCIQTIIAVLLPTPVLADTIIDSVQRPHLAPEINMVIAASKKQSKPVDDSVQKPQVSPASATADPAPEQTTVPLTKTQRAQLKAIDAQLRYWIAQEKAKPKANEAAKLGMTIGQNVKALWLQKYAIEEAPKPTK